MRISILKVTSISVLITQLCWAQEFDKAAKDSQGMPSAPCTTEPVQLPPEDKEPMKSIKMPKEDPELDPKEMALEDPDDSSRKEHKSMSVLPEKNDLNKPK